MAFQQQWGLYQTAFGEMISSAASVVKHLNKINGKDFSTTVVRDEIEDTLKTISDLTLKNFKDALAKLERLKQEKDRGTCIDCNQCDPKFQASDDAMSNPLALITGVLKIDSIRQNSIES